MVGLDRLVADERAVLLKVVDAQPVVWACLGSFRSLVFGLKSPKRPQEPVLLADTPKHIRAQVLAQNLYTKVLKHIMWRLHAEMVRPCLSLGSSGSKRICA